MQPASAATVLGDFGDTKLENFGAVFTFSRAGDKFMVRTEWPDGAPHDYEIAYTFGVYPLQQYLIAFAGGRYQATYRFRLAGPVHYQFRALSKYEAAFPFIAGASPVVNVFES